MAAVLEKSVAPAASTSDFESDVRHVCKMLSDSNRLRIMFLLLKTLELNVTELCESLSQSQPAVSHHLALLKDAHLLKVRRDGKHNYYSVRREQFSAVISQLLESIDGPVGDASRTAPESVQRDADVSPRLAVPA